MYRSDINDLAHRYDAFVATDGKGFRRAARILQSIWRTNKGYPAGEHNGRPLGSRLPEDFARETLANYLTPTIQDIVRTELLSAATDGRLFASPRIYNDLLSSQPLCFNLFGELKADLELASAVFRTLRPEAVKNVTEILFEHSPGRGDPRFTGDRSAFDVFIKYNHISGGRGFFGIEVKYHENLKDQPAPHRPRYNEVAAVMRCFRPQALPHLRQAPLQQIWRDHLLAGATKRELGYKEGVFVFLAPGDNNYCASAIRAYRDTLSDISSFDTWTLETIVDALKKHTRAKWVNAFHERYLDFSILQNPPTP